MTPANMKTATLRGISLFVAVVFLATSIVWSPSEAIAALESLELTRQIKFQKELQSYLYSMPSEMGTIQEASLLGTNDQRLTTNDRAGRQATVDSPNSDQSKHRGDWGNPDYLQVRENKSQDKRLSKTGEDRFVIHIQDAHANPEAQQNIARILSYLTQKYPDLAIGVEGAAGPLHPEYLNFFSEYPEANQAVVEDLRQKGELNGAELFLLEKRQDGGWRTEDGASAFPPSALRIPSSVFGVEDPALYRDNLKTYRELLFKRDEIQMLLNPVRAELEKESSLKLNAELREFLKERSRRKEGKYDATGSASDPNLQAYVRYLEKQALKALAIDLKDPIEQLRFPNLLRIVKIEETQKGFDLEKARGQWEEVMEMLKTSAKDKGEKEFVEAFAAFGQEKGYLSDSLAVDRGPLTAAGSAALYPRKLLEGLFRFGKKHKLTFERREAFWQSWKLAVFQAEIDVTELLSEMTRLEDGLIQKLARSEDEKAIVQKIGRFDLLEKLMRLELSRPEYEKALDGRDALNDFVRSSASLQKALEKAFFFYEGTLRRDRALLENALKITDDGKPAFTTSGIRHPTSKVVVLITGGFHTDGIEQILREKGIGYANVTPRITKTDHGEMYQRVMSDANADLSAYFKVKNPFATKQEAILFKQVLEVAAPVLFDKYQVQGANMAGRVQKAFADSPVLSKAVVSERLQDASTLRFTPKPSVAMLPKNAAIPNVPVLAAQAFAADVSSALTRDGAAALRVEVRFSEKAALRLAIKPSGEGMVSFDHRSEARSQAQIQREIRDTEVLKNGARMRARQFLKYNRELIQWFLEWDKLRKIGSEEDGEAAELVQQRIRGYSETFKEIAGKIRPDSQNGIAGETERYAKMGQYGVEPSAGITQEEVTTGLVAESRLLKEALDKLPAQFLKAHREKDLATLQILNEQAVALLKARLKSQLLQASSYLNEEKINKMALLMVLTAIRLGYLKLSHQYGWRIRRALEEAAIQKIKVVGGEGTIRTVYDYQNFKMTVEEDAQGKTNPLTIYQDSWVRQDLEDGSFIYKPERKPHQFESLPDAVRSRIHTLLSQELDYMQVYDRVNDLDYMADLLKTHGEELPGYFMEDIRESVDFIMQGRPGGLERGRVDQKGNAAQDIRTAMAELEAGHRERAIEMFDAARTELESRLTDIERKKNGIDSQAEYLIHRFRLSETAAVMRELKKLIGENRFKEGYQLLRLFYKTHYLSMASEESQYASLQRSISRLGSAFRKLSDWDHVPERSKGPLLVSIREDMRRINLMTGTRSEMRNVDGALELLKGQAEDLVRKAQGVVVSLDGDPGLLSVDHVNFGTNDPEDTNVLFLENPVSIGKVDGRDVFIRSNDRLVTSPEIKRIAEKVLESLSSERSEVPFPTFPELQEYLGGPDHAPSISFFDEHFGEVLNAAEAMIPQKIHSPVKQEEVRFQIEKRRAERGLRSQVMTRVAGSGAVLQGAQGKTLLDGILEDLRKFDPQLLKMIQQGDIQKAERAVTSRLQSDLQAGRFSDLPELVVAYAYLGLIAANQLLFQDALRMLRGARKYFNAYPGKFPDAHKLTSMRFYGLMVKIGEAIVGRKFGTEVKEENYRYLKNRGALAALSGLFSISNDFLDRYKGISVRGQDLKHMGAYRSRLKTMKRAFGRSADKFSARTESGEATGRAEIRDVELARAVLGMDMTDAEDVAALRYIQGRLLKVSAATEDTRKHYAAAVQVATKFLNGGSQPSLPEDSLLLSAIAGFLLNPSHEGRPSTSDEDLLKTLKTLVSFDSLGSGQLRFPLAVRALSELGAPVLSLTDGKLRISRDFKEQQTGHFLRYVPVIGTRPEIEPMLERFAIYSGLSGYFRAALDSQKRDFAFASHQKAREILARVDEMTGRSETRYLAEGKIESSEQEWTLVDRHIGKFMTLGAAAAAGMSYLSILALKGMALNGTLGSLFPVTVLLGWFAFSPVLIPVGLAVVGFIKIWEMLSDYFSSKKSAVNLIPASGPVPVIEEILPVSGRDSGTHRSEMQQNLVNFGTSSALHGRARSEMRIVPPTPDQDQVQGVPTRLPLMLGLAMGSLIAGMVFPFFISSEVLEAAKAVLGASSVGVVGGIIAQRVLRQFEQNRPERPEEKENRRAELRQSKTNERLYAGLFASLSNRTVFAIPVAGDQAMPQGDFVPTEIVPVPADEDRELFLKRTEQERLEKAQAQFDAGLSVIQERLRAVKQEIEEKLPESKQAKQNLTAIRAVLEATRKKLAALHDKDLSLKEVEAQRKELEKDLSVWSQSEKGALSVAQVATAYLPFQSQIEDVILSEWLGVIDEEEMKYFSPEKKVEKIARQQEKREKIIQEMMEKNMSFSTIFHQKVVVEGQEALKKVTTANSIKGIQENILSSQRIFWSIRDQEMQERKSEEIDRGEPGIDGDIALFVKDPIPPETYRFTLYPKYGSKLRVIVGRLNTDSGDEKTMLLNHLKVIIGSDPNPPVLIMMEAEAFDALYRSIQERKVSGVIVSSGDETRGKQGQIIADPSEKTHKKFAEEARLQRLGARSLRKYLKAAVPGRKDLLEKFHVNAIPGAMRSIQEIARSIGARTLGIGLHRTEIMTAEMEQNVLSATETLNVALVDGPEAALFEPLPEETVSDQTREKLNEMKKIAKDEMLSWYATPAVRTILDFMENGIEDELADPVLAREILRKRLFDFRDDKDERLFKLLLKLGIIKNPKTENGFDLYRKKFGRMMVILQTAAYLTSYAGARAKDHAELEVIYPMVKGLQDTEYFRQVILPVAREIVVLRVKGRQRAGSADADSAAGEAKARKSVLAAESKIRFGTMLETPEAIRDHLDDLIQDPFLKVYNFGMNDAQTQEVARKMVLGVLEVGVDKLLAELLSLKEDADAGQRKMITRWQGGMAVAVQEIDEKGTADPSREVFSLLEKAAQEAEGAGADNLRSRIDQARQEIERQVKGIQVERKDAWVAGLVGHLDPKFLILIDQVAERFQSYNQGQLARKKKSLCFCGEIAQSLAFGLFLKHLELKYPDVPFSRSMAPSALPENIFLDLQLRDLDPREVKSIFGGYDARTEEEAFRLASSSMDSAREALTQAEDFNDEFQQEGFYYAFYRKDIDPLHGIRSIGMFDRIKAMAVVLSKLQSSTGRQTSLKPLEGLSPQARMKQAELDRVLEALSGILILLPEEKKEVGEAFRFMTLVRILYLRMQRRDPAHFKGILQNKNLDAFLEEFEKRYSGSVNMDWLSNSTAHPLSEAERQKKRDDFLEKYHRYANAVFNCFVRLTHVTLQEIFPPEIVPGGALRILDTEQGPVELSTQQRLHGYMFERAEGFEVEDVSELTVFAMPALKRAVEKDTEFGKMSLARAVKERPDAFSPVLVRVLEDLQKHDVLGRLTVSDFLGQEQFSMMAFEKLATDDPSLMLDVFALTGRQKSQRQLRISYRLQRTMVKVVRGVRNFFDQPQLLRDRLAEKVFGFLSLNADVSYGMWRLHRWHIFDKICPSWAKTRSVFPPGEHRFAIHMQTLQTFEFMEKLSDFSDHMLFQVARAFQKTRTASDRNKIASLRLAVLVDGILRAQHKGKIDQAPPSKDEVKAAVKEILKDKGVPEEIEENVVWLCYNHRTLGIRELVTADDISDAASVILRHLKNDSAGGWRKDAIEMVDMLFIMMVSSHFGLTDPEKIVLRTREGANSPLVAWTAFYLTVNTFIAEALVEDESVPQKPGTVLEENIRERLKDAQSRILQAGLTEWSGSRLKEALPQLFDPKFTKTVLAEYEATAGFEKKDPLREKLRSLFRTDASISSAFERYKKWAGPYMIRILMKKPKDLVQHILFFNQIGFLEEAKDAQTVATAFLPLPAQSGKAPYEILIGSGTADSDLEHRFSTVLFKNGFFIEHMATFESPDKGKGLVFRFLGSFNGEEEHDEEKVIEKIRKDLEKIFGPVRFLRVRLSVPFKQPRVAGRTFNMDDDKEYSFIRLQRQPQDEGARTNVSFLRDSAAPGVTVAVVETPDRPGLISFVTGAVLRAFPGMQIAKRKILFGDLAGGMPKTYLYLTQKGRPLSKSEEDHFKSSMERWLDADSITMTQGKIEEPVGFTPRSEVRESFLADSPQEDILGTKDLSGPAQALTESQLDRNLVAGLLWHFYSNAFNSLFHSSGNGAEAPSRNGAEVIKASLMAVSKFPGELEKTRSFFVRRDEAGYEELSFRDENGHSIVNGFGTADVLATARHFSPEETERLRGNMDPDQFLPDLRAISEDAGMLARLIEEGSDAGSFKKDFRPRLNVFAEQSMETIKRVQQRLTGEESAGAKGEQNAGGAVSGLSGWTSARRILVVDDEPGILKLWTTILKGMGFEVIAASNGYEAMKKISGFSKRKWADLVISDIFMPEINGLKFAEGVSEISEAAHRQPPPFIFVSGFFANLEFSARFIGRLRYEQLPKPVATEDFIKTIGALCPPFRKPDLAVSDTRSEARTTPKIPASATRKKELAAQLRQQVNNSKRWDIIEKLNPGAKVLQELLAYANYLDEHRKDRVSMALAAWTDPTESVYLDDFAYKVFRDSTVDVLSDEIRLKVRDVLGEGERKFTPQFRGLTVDLAVLLKAILLTQRAHKILGVKLSSARSDMSREKLVEEAAQKTKALAALSPAQLIEQARDQARKVTEATHENYFRNTALQQLNRILWKLDPNARERYPLTSKDLADMRDILAVAAMNRVLDFKPLRFNVPPIGRTGKEPVVVAARVTPDVRSELRERISPEVKMRSERRKSIAPKPLAVRWDSGRPAVDYLFQIEAGWRPFAFMDRMNVRAEKNEWYLTDRNGKELMNTSKRKRSEHVVLVAKAQDFLLKNQGVKCLAMDPETNIAGPDFSNSLAAGVSGLSEQGKKIFVMAGGFHDISFVVELSGRDHQELSARAAEGMLRYSKEDPLSAKVVSAAVLGHSDLWNLAEGAGQRVLFFKSPESLGRWIRELLDAGLIGPDGVRPFLAELKTVFVALAFSDIQASGDRHPDNAFLNKMQAEADAIFDHPKIPLAAVPVLASVNPVAAAFVPKDKPGILEIVLRNDNLAGWIADHVEETGRIALEPGHGTYTKQELLKTPDVLFLKSFDDEPGQRELFTQRFDGRQKVTVTTGPDGVKTYTFVPVRSEIRDAKAGEAPEIKRPLDMPEEARKQVKKIFIMANQGKTTRKLSKAAILLPRFVVRLMEKFPEAKVDIAADYNLFATESFSERVAMVPDPDRKPIMMESPEGIRTIKIPGGVLGDALNGQYDDLASWAIFNKYDYVFDFTGCGAASIEDAFLDAVGEQGAEEKSSRLPVIFANMNPLPENDSVSEKKPEPVFMIDPNNPEGNQLYRIAGTENLMRPTPEGRRPLYEEQSLRIVRELGFFPEKMDLEKAWIPNARLTAVEKQWIRQQLDIAFLQSNLNLPQETQGVTPALAEQELLGNRKIIYVNTYSDVESMTADEWVNFLSELQKNTGAFLLFSAGGTYQDGSFKKLEEILKQLRGMQIPVGKVPGVFSTGKVQTILQAMDLVVTPLNGFSYLATGVNTPQIAIALQGEKESLWRPFLGHSRVEEKDALLKGPVVNFAKETLSKESSPRRRAVLGLVNPETKQNKDEIEKQLMMMAVKKYKRILVVDDERMLATLMKTVLKSLKLGSEAIDVAHDGGEGLAKLKVGKYDFVLTDVNMPVMSGDDMLLKAAGEPEIPEFHALIVSGYDSARVIDRKAEFEEAKISHRVLEKPYGRNDVKGAILELVWGENFSSQRSEVRLAGTEEYKQALLTQDAPAGQLLADEIQLQAIGSIAAELGNIFSEEGLGLYAPDWSKTQVRAWIASQLLEPLRVMAENQGLKNEKLRQVLQDIGSFVRADLPEAVEPAQVKQELVLHSHMPKLEDPVWEQFKLKLPVLLGALVMLRAKLFINIDVEGSVAERMQKEVGEIAAQNSIVLGEQAIVFYSVLGKNPMNSLALEKKVDGRLAEKESMVPASGRHGSRWLYSDKALSDGFVLAADITTVLYALMDPRISLSDLHRPSQFGQLLEAVRNAMEGYQAIKQAA